MSYQQITWDYLKGRGLNEKSIAAIMGNIQAESSFDPDVIESGNGIGFGLCQWSYSRRTQLEAYGIDIQHQLNFLWSELTGEDLEITGADYQWINQSNYLNHTDFMSGNGTIEDLTASFCFSWERPNILYAHLPLRQSSALEYYAQFHGTVVDPPPTGTYVKLIYPYWYGSNLKISYNINKFLLINSHGNVVMIKNPTNNRRYFVNKSFIKML